MSFVFRRGQRGAGAVTNAVTVAITRALLTAGLLATAQPMLAADQAPALTLLEAQRIAVGRSQQLVAQDALASAARAQGVAAGQLPDPVLTLGLDNLPADGPDRFSVSRDFMTMRRIGIMQEITRSEKRQLRTERFERDAQRAEAQRQSSLASVQRHTALAWLDAYYADAQRVLIAQQIDEARSQVDAAGIAFRAGKGSQAEVFAARAGVIGLEDQLSVVDQKSRNAVLMLARWIGATAAQRPPSGSPSWQTPPMRTEALRDHLQQHPELLVMAAELETARTEARLAEANQRADISVEASYAQRGSAYSNMLSIGVSIPLQWDQKNRQQQELSARLALVEQARARYEDQLRANEAEVRGLLNEWQSGQERVRRLRDELLPNARQRTQAALTSYRIGQSDLASALAARRDETEVRLQTLALEMETARAWAQLHYLIPDPRISPQAPPLTNSTTTQEQP